MALEEKIKPVNKDHSIKEAVISLFLALPIIKPERFNELIETKFKELFQQFEPLFQVQVQIKNQPGASPDLSQQIFNNAGFKFNSFDKGQAVRILQGLNDAGNSRTYISYHALNYSRWDPFFKEYIDAISVISAFSPDLFVTAISLQYVDEFLLLTSEAINQDAIFNTSAEYIPKEFFKSRVNQYSISTEKDIAGGMKYLDRLEIKYERLIRPSISIIHNVTMVFPEIVSLPTLLQESHFQEKLNQAHLQNKGLLRDILTDDLIKMINL